MAAYTSSASDSKNAFFAYTESRVDDDIRSGHAIVAWAAPGARSNILLVPGQLDPLSSTIAHDDGELIFDTTQDLWLCVTGGTPGTWRKIAGRSTAGAFHPISPKRVWDTRFQGGEIGGDEARTISVANGRALGSSTIDEADLVREGATAVTFNLTILSRSNTGFLAVTPGDGATFGASTINWTSNNSVIANGTLSSLDDSRQLTLWTSEFGEAHAIVDITGYYL